MENKTLCVSSILVVGHKGWIGQMIMDRLERMYLNAVVPPDDLRPEDIDGFRAFLHRVKPSHIISLIGRTHGKIGETEYPTIDYLEQEGKLRENVRDNLLAPLSLAFLAKEIGAHFTYMGTGCIFGYDEAHPCSEEGKGFTEDDVPNFFGSAYSTVKGSTDVLLNQFFSDTVLNLRIRMPITTDKNPRNFVSKITSYKKICSIENSMSVLPELIPMAMNLAVNNYTGTLNLVNPGTISHNEILAMYKEIVDPEFTWENFSLEEQNQILSAGRSNNKLDTTKLEELFPQILPIRESVKVTLERMANPRRRKKPEKIVITVPMV